MHCEILCHGKSWTCDQAVWKDYFELAKAFGFFNHDEGGRSGVLPTRGLLLNKSLYGVDGESAKAFGAALHRAIDTVKARAPMTLEQEMAFKPFEFHMDELIHDRAEYPDVRTIRTRHGSFDVDLGMVMKLAKVVSAGIFTIA
jgi:hypothetical protein